MEVSRTTKKFWKIFFHPTTIFFSFPPISVELPSFHFSTPLRKLSICIDFFREDLGIRPAFLSKIKRTKEKSGKIRKNRPHNKKMFICIFFDKICANISQIFENCIKFAVFHGLFDELLKIFSFLRVRSPDPYKASTGQPIYWPPYFKFLEKPCLSGLRLSLKAIL